jgi:hypothetical protein
MIDVSFQALKIQGLEEMTNARGKIDVTKAAL